MSESSYPSVPEPTPQAPTRVPLRRVTAVTTPGPHGRPSLRRWLRTAPGVLAMGVLLVLAGGFVANTSQTAGGTVRVTQVSFATACGTMLTGLLYVPATATA